MGTKKNRQIVLRRMIETEKFYLFDVGVTNFLSRRSPKIGTPEFGKSFEHYILMELKACKAYAKPDMDISYWRTASGYDCCLIYGIRLNHLGFLSKPI
jgi:predicted AAA+ superfamily ATPase